MNYLLALIGALCLVGGIHADSLTDTINGNLTLQLTNFTTSLTTINATITAADKNTIKAWNNWGNTSINNLTAIYNRFKTYPIDFTSLTSVISSLTFTLNTSQPTLFASDTSLFSSYAPQISQQINDTGSLLLTAAANMSSQITCTNDFAASCYKKYGANLTASPILLSRYVGCVTAENTRIANIGINVTGQINSTMATVQTYLNLLNICNIPTAASLASSQPPSLQCLTTFLNNLSRSQITSWGSAVDSVRYQQNYLVYFRIQRCAKLVSLDIQDAVARVQNSFTSCLSTGV
ncbi:uncharacterized protein LOC129723350 [Wyeomyia smithii]|uniref:uncharacterized protein LOC129723350 n=1 Tax=Wyeomyia smithii TaxID=174621 RepID=UPI002467D3CA|nr:uncharacterized protein LOC129723350 [Wyeomyia smithii]